MKKQKPRTAALLNRVRAACKKHEISLHGLIVMLNKKYLTDDAKVCDRAASNWFYMGSAPSAETTLALVELCNDLEGRKTKQAK